MWAETTTAAFNKYIIIMTNIYEVPNGALGTPARRGTQVQI